MRVRFATPPPVRDAPGRRQFAAAGALAAGRGGVEAAACATGIVRGTIGRGLAGLRSGEKIDAARVRAPER